MELLELSQIIFNITVSTAFLVAIITAVIVAYVALAFIKTVKKLAEDVSEKSAQALGKLNFILSGASLVSFIMKLFKKNNKTRSE